MRLRITIAFLLSILLLLPFSQNALATGDCDNDGTVTIAEVQSAINMFLGLKQPALCVDEDNNGVVSIAEVQKTINSFLGVIPTTSFFVSGIITLNGSGFNGVTLTMYNTSFSIYSVFGNLYGTGEPVLSSVAAVATTGPDGAYSFTGVSSGSYTIVPSYTGYLFSLANKKYLDKTEAFSLILNDPKIYFYDSQKTGNSVIGDPPTIIYNRTVANSGNTVSGLNFTAAIPIGTGL